MDLATRRMLYYGLLGLLIAGSTIAVFREAPKVLPVIPILVKDGTFSIYFKNIPSDISGDQGMTNTGLLPVTLDVNAHLLTIVSVNITIDSIIIHKNGTNDSGWTDTLHAPITLDLLQQTSGSVLIDSVKIPSENVTVVELHVSRATATVSVLGVVTPVSVDVSSENLKIHIVSGARVEPQMTTRVVAARPHIAVGSGDVIRLTPVLSVDSISGPD